MYLYVKTHNVTGLKYLGITINDPHTYKGSGTKWNRHLKEHGNDVSTEVLLVTDDLKKLRKVSKYYSELWDIKNSESFANSRMEGGCFTVRAAKKPHTNDRVSPWISGKKLSLV